MQVHYVSASIHSFCTPQQWEAGEKGDLPIVESITEHCLSLPDVIPADGRGTGGVTGYVEQGSQFRK